MERRHLLRIQDAAAVAVTVKNNLFIRWNEAAEEQLRRSGRSGVGRISYSEPGFGRATALMLAVILFLGAVRSVCGLLWQVSLSTPILNCRK